MPPLSTPPDEVYGELFEAVQLSGIFTDSKSFVDAIPRSAPGAIVAAFGAHRDDPDFNLAEFVGSNFELPRAQRDARRLSPAGSLRRHIDGLWDVLFREADTVERHSSLIPLPHAYIVPGGRFREIYYWDSYFTMLGLAASGRHGLIRAMVDNFAHLIRQVGRIPNGNRTYYCSRSQPPLFAAMVKLLADVEGRREVLVDYLGALEAEYRFWMAGAASVQGGEAAEARVVGVGDALLNRYWDDLDRPRPESYAEDLWLAAASARTDSSLFRDIRAACESGWDFSSRWLREPADSTSIRTTRVLPVDLNAILYGLESTLAEACGLARRAADESAYRALAENRKRLIRERFFDPGQGFFHDLWLPDFEPTAHPTLAAAFPLFFGIASQAQAERVCARLMDDFLRPGGWLTTLVESGQQWDAPNGWAPLHWIAYRGLMRYGFEDEAREGARRWVSNNILVFENTGRLFEKYNVETVGALSGGGEYEVQHGFGWTNGVLLALMDELGFD